MVTSRSGRHSLGIHNASGHHQGRGGVGIAREPQDVPLGQQVVCPWLRFPHMAPAGVPQLQEPVAAVQLPSAWQVRVREPDRPAPQDKVSVAPTLNGAPVDPVQVTGGGRQLLVFVGPQPFAPQVREAEPVVPEGQARVST